VVAAVMIGIGGFFNLVDGLVGITNAHYDANITRTYDVDLVVTNTIRTWGWVALQHDLPAGVPPRVSVLGFGDPDTRCARHLCAGRPGPPDGMSAAAWWASPRCGGR
jgi:hypothetical protein